MQTNYQKFELVYAQTKTRTRDELNYCSSQAGIGQEVSPIGKPSRLFCGSSFPAISRNAMISIDATKKVLRSASRISLPINEMGVAKG